MSKSKPKMGRPELPDSERRELFVSTRVNQGEYDEIHAAIKSSSEAKTEWIRKKLVAAARREA